MRGGFRLMSLWVAIGIVIASAGRLRLEDRLVQKAGVLHAAVNPTASLQVAGVARVDKVLSSDACAVLKQHILTLRDQAVAPTAQRWAVWMGAADSRYIPGSRVRFSSALEERLTPQRSDVLLPLESGLVADALRTAHRASPRGTRASGGAQSAGNTRGTRAAGRRRTRPRLR